MATVSMPTHAQLTSHESLRGDILRAVARPVQSLLLKVIMHNWGTIVIWRRPADLEAVNPSIKVRPSVANSEIGHGHGIR